MLIENGTQWRSWGTLFPRAMVRYLPPRAGVVRGTLLLATYVMYAVVGWVFRTPAKPLGVPSRSLGEGHRGRVLHKGTPPLSTQPVLLSLYAVRRGRP